MLKPTISSAWAWASKPPAYKPAQCANQPFQATHHTPITVFFTDAPSNITHRTTLPKVCQSVISHITRVKWSPCHGKCQKWIWNLNNQLRRLSWFQYSNSNHVNLHAPDQLLDDTNSHISLHHPHVSAISNINFYPIIINFLLNINLK